MTSTFRRISTASPICFTAASVILLTSNLASASLDRPQNIYQGTEVAECGWPSVVYLREAGCTGTLVHPEVVLFASHCGIEVNTVTFGEDGEGAPARQVLTDECFKIPTVLAEGIDVAACRLAEPVTDVPIVPILMGCELDALQVGADVALIGFGMADSGPPGIKRETFSKIADFPGNEVAVKSDDGHGVCYGDSGGPVMLQLPGGGWRVFGIASYILGECGSGSYYSLMHTNIEWFEQHLNLDITPCHTPDGTWDPGPECGDFALQPGEASGTWATGCQAELPLSGPGASCGAAYDGESDDVPPQVEIVGLTQGQQFESEGPLPLKIVARASDGPGMPDGWGIAEVRLVFDAQEVPGGTREAGPYAWNVGLPTGGYLVSALAIDHAGNAAYAAPIAIGVNEPAPALPEEGTTGDLETTGEPTSTGEAPTTSSADSSDTTGSDSSSSTGASEAGVTTAAGSDDGGCGCRQHDGAAGALALLALLGRRRRNSPRS